MRKTKKITLSAMIIALGTVLMVLGAMVDVLDLSVCALASLFVAFVYIEIGSPYPFFVWLGTSLATFLFFPGSIIWLEYLLVFGLYPILKAYVERLPRWSWIILKLVYINAVLIALIFLVELIIKVPFFGVDSLLIKAGVYALLNVAFFAYDIFITVLIRFYFERLRHRFRNLLK